MGDAYQILVGNIVKCWYKFWNHVSVFFVFEKGVVQFPKSRSSTEGVSFTQDNAIQIAL